MCIRDRLNTNHVIGEFTINVLNKLEQKGVDIILATGRNHMDVSSILGKIGAEPVSYTHLDVYKRQPCSLTQCR